MADYVIKRTDLVAALDAVKGSVPKKSFSQILTHVLFEDACLFGFDSEIGIKVKLDCDPSIKFNLPFEKFNNLIRSLNGADVMFHVNGKQIGLKCDRHTSAMQQILEDKFPSPNIETADAQWHPVPAGFKEALEKAMLASSEREQEKVLSTVMIRGNTVISTDRTKLVRCHLESSLHEQPILLARKAVTEIIRLGNPIKMLVSGAWSLWDYGNLTFMARLREGANEYPDVGHLFDTLKPTAEELVPDGLVGILGRLKLFADTFEVRTGLGATELVAAGELSNAVETIDTMTVTVPKKFPCEPLMAAAPYGEQMNWMGANQPLYLKGQNFEFMLTQMLR